MQCVPSNDVRDADQLLENIKPKRRKVLFSNGAPQAAQRRNYRSACQHTCQVHHLTHVAGIPGDAAFPGRAGARAQLYAAGYKQADFGKAVVTVAAPYLSIHMCNQKFRQLADTVAGSVICGA